MPVNKDFYTLAGSSGQSTGYTIDQSIRFNAADNAYMHRTPSSTGNRKTFTSSFWVKLGNIEVNTSLPTPQVTHGAGSSGLALVANEGTLTAYTYYSGSWSGFLKTNRVFRDPTAWYHFVYIVDSTQSVASERIRIYVNGIRESSFSTETYLAQNQDTDWNLSGEKMWLGRDGGGSGYDGEYYAAEIHWLDGYAYGPEYFGEFDENGIWIPKEYTGSYGTNGFKIDGRDSSDLGDDESGNGNDFTTVSLAANDQKADTPTNNHCVMNNLVPGSATFSNGNLDLSHSASAWTAARGTIGIPYNSGIYYYEAKVLSHAIYLSFGWGDVDMGQNQNSNPATPKYYVYSDYSGKYYSSTDDGSIGDGFTNNDVIGLWYDSGSTSNNLKFYRNGTLQSSGTKSFDFSDVAHVTAVTLYNGSNSVEYRFAADEWTQAPSGITAANAITTNNIGS